MLQCGATQATECGKPERKTHVADAISQLGDRICALEGLVDRAIAKASPILRQEPQIASVNETIKGDDVRSTPLASEILDWTERISGVNNKLAYMLSMMEV